MACYNFIAMEQNRSDAHNKGMDGGPEMPEMTEVAETPAPTHDSVLEPVDIQLARACSTAIESLLFVAGRPLERDELRKLLEVSEELLTAALQLLEQDLVQQARGIRLQRLGQQVQLVTAPENARYIAALLGLPMTVKLTAAALETLAVIAYRQPVTRGQIEAVRGVNSDRALASLLQHGLVIEVGRAATPGRPALFATTGDFLQQFGLTSLADLPGVTEPAPLNEDEQLH
ncbi:SMC-Scp complex subunit ScpB [Ktedonobacteria bacterium brp13]|nr:SMC-Scp complex subunit ScpB [Ktedonobacteria bacterium brp13]